MLHLLEVHNFGRIASARLHLPQAGFCAVTGETGMGKSMLVDALTSVLGGRITRKLLRPGARQCELCAAFSLPPDHPALQALAEQGLAVDDGELVIRRLIDAAERSKGYVNGKFVSRAQLQQAAAGIISICGQHEHMQLAKPARRRQLLDAAAAATELSEKISAAHADLARCRQHLDELLKRQQEHASRAAELREQLGEIEQAGVNTEQLADCERVATLQAGAAELGERSSELTGNCAELARLIAKSRAGAKRMAELDGRYAPCGELLAELQALVEELEREANKANAELSLPDAQAAQEAEGYLAEAHRLARKYKLISPQALIEHAAALRAELNAHDGLDVQQARRAAAAAQQAWEAGAKKLSKLRGGAAGRLSKRVVKSLAELGMPQARFEIALAPEQAPTAHGAEDVEYKFAAGAKAPLGDLAAAASGGELSRAFLALFANVENDDGRDLVFDEVDAGVGGKVAAEVGTLLARLGGRRLVVCVTHLPQVAAAAAHHWQVATDANGSGVCRQISGEQREREIARMLAGRKITQASLANARDIMAAAAV